MILWFAASLHVRACARACVSVRACVRACVCVRARARVCVRARVYMCCVCVSTRILANSALEPLPRRRHLLQLAKRLVKILVKFDAKVLVKLT